MSCNSESRRAINYSQQEPINNKYDLWLSENLRYNSEGTLVYDSPGQPACDLILKIYKDGDWRPIAGLNTDHIVTNKINIVPGHIENHLPLFKDPQLSPDELFDAGTLGEAIYQYVTELEWQNIFEGDAFTNAFEYYFPTIINNGGININTLIKPAEKTKLGGIWADEFSIEDMFPDTEESRYYTSQQINNSDNWIAQAKYKYHYNSNSSHLDYNLYVNAKDVIEAINNYITNNPGAPGVQPGNDFEWRLANTERIGGIRAAQDPQDADDCRNIPIVLAGPNVGSIWGLPFGSGDYPGDHDELTEYLYLPGWALMEWMKNPYFNQQNPTPFISGWKGVDTQLRENSDLIWVGLSGVTPENIGRFCTIKFDNTDPSGTTIDWVDLPEGETYTLLGPDSSALGKYVVKGGSDDKHFLNGDGDWTIPTGQTYYGGSYIKIGQDNHIDIKPTTQDGDLFLSCYDGILGWRPSPSQYKYPRLGRDSYGSFGTHSNFVDYVVTGCGDDVVNPANLFLNGNGGWTQIDTNQIEGNGINTFIYNNKIYIRPYICFIDADNFVLDPSVQIDVNSLNPYPNNRYPLVSFVDYQAQHQNGISSIKIESDQQVYLQQPSYMSFETSAKCTFTFPKSMEFIETVSVNSSTHEDCFYTDTDYIIQLKPATKYNVTFYKSCIKFETNSNSIFDEPFNE